MIKTIEQKWFTNVATLSTAAAAGTTTFDPSNIGTGASLSGGNLVLTTTTGSGGTGTCQCRAINAHSTGKYYCEFTINQIGSTNASNLGLCNASAALSGQGGFGYDSSSNSCGIFDQGGYITINGGSATAIWNYSVNDIIAMAVDCGAGLLWFKDITASSNWNNSGSNNPATGVGGYSLSAGGFSGPYYPGAGCKHATNTKITANFGGSSYAGTVPSGFGNW
jgi:hypothetical protein